MTNTELYNRFQELDYPDDWKISACTINGNTVQASYKFCNFKMEVEDIEALKSAYSLYLSRPFQDTIVKHQEPETYAARIEKFIEFVHSSISDSE